MKYVTREMFKTKKVMKNLQKIFLLVCAIILFVAADSTVTHAAAKLNMTNCTLFAGDNAKLTVTGYKGYITWKSSKKSVASVDDGQIWAKKAGKAVISAKCGSKTLKCSVTVLKDRKYSYENSNTLILSNGGIDSQKAQVGEMYDFALDNNGSYFVDRRDDWIYDENDEKPVTVIWKTYDNDGELITWSSSDESIARVSQDGLVFFNKPGYVTITAKTASKLAKVGFNVRSASPTINEKKQILDAIVKKLKKAGVKVSLGVTDKTASWTEYEESEYAKIYGGKHLSRDAYMTGQTGFTMTLNSAADLSDDDIKRDVGREAILYYAYSHGLSFLNIHFW